MSNGGFIQSHNLDGSLTYDPKPHSGRIHQDNQEDDESDKESGGSPTLNPTHNSNAQRRLTSRQEDRLRTYLDDKLLETSREWKKRHTPSSSLSTLPSFLSSHRTLLSILGSIPPLTSSSTSLLISYLLRITSDLTEGISGYSLQSSKSDSTQLSQALVMLDLLDKLWSAILNGRMLNFKNAEIGSLRTEEKRSGNNRIGHQYSIRSGSLDPFSRSMSATPAPDFSSSSNNQVESFSVSGSRGISTIGQTDRVRLRNLLVGSKEQLFVWMRKVLDAPAPPKLMGMTAQEETEELFGWRDLEGGDLEKGAETSGIDESSEIDALEQKVAKEEKEEESRLMREGEEQEDQEDEMEEVQLDDQSEKEEVKVIEDQRYRQPQQDRGSSRWETAEDDQQREEHEHFRQLFERKLDPDASDSDSEIEQRREPEPKPKTKPSTTTSLSIPFNQPNTSNIDSDQEVSSNRSSTSISKKRKISPQADGLSSTIGNKNSRSKNQSIFHKLNQASTSRLEESKSPEKTLDLPYEGAPPLGGRAVNVDGEGEGEEKGEEGKDQADRDLEEEEENDSETNESEATFSGSLGNDVLLWDLTFSRLFSRTLKGLAERLSI